MGKKVEKLFKPTGKSSVYTSISSLQATSVSLGASTNRFLNGMYFKILIDRTYRCCCCC
jgi:hypothetical protein